MSKQVLLDLDNGDIEELEGCRILKPKSIEYLNKTTEWKKKEEFVKLYSDVMLDLVAEQLTPTEFNLIFIMLRYLRYESGIVAYDNGKHMNTKQIIAEANVYERSGYKAMQSLVEKNIIGKFNLGNKISILMNPYIFSRGSRVNKTLIELFKDTKWAKKN